MDLLQAGGTFILMHAFYHDSLLTLSSNLSMYIAKASVMAI